MAYKCSRNTKVLKRSIAIAMEQQMVAVMKLAEPEEKRRFRCARCGKLILSQPEGPLQVAEIESKIFDGRPVVVCLDEVYPTETWEEPLFENRWMESFDKK